VLPIGILGSIWLMRADGSHQRRLFDSESGSEITALDWGSLARSGTAGAHMLGR